VISGVLAQLIGTAGHAAHAIGHALAYELACWTNHYASHHVPLLCEFHKVHHTAEVLTPLTNFRVHPVDSIVFGNFLAVFAGVAAGLATYLLGGQHGPFMLGHANAILVVFLILVIPLQHSHFWIAATGPLGRVLMSPAHHQIHHSDDPAHHDTNFGSCLAIWDWLFGTLVIPQRTRQRLSFGSGPRLAANHTAAGTMLTPFARAWRRSVSAVASAAKPARGAEAQMPQPLGASETQDHG
jgi:sterol desaturase/sphingolipid hydroxylase (fatty acid hydroxylase superfamily)